MHCVTSHKRHSRIHVLANWGEPELDELNACNLYTIMLNYCMSVVRHPIDSEVVGLAQARPNKDIASA